jgi:hypothetical protein
MYSEEQATWLNHHSVDVFRFPFKLLLKVFDGLVSGTIVKIEVGPVRIEVVLTLKMDDVTGLNELSLFIGPSTK